MKKLTIDPALFTDSQWEEASATDADRILQQDRRSDAKPVKATRHQVLDLAELCRAKALRVMDGELGDSDPGGDGVDVNEWGMDLISAAEVLEKIAGVESRKRTSVIALDSSQLATVLAALRMFQRKYEDCDGDTIAADWPDHFTDENGGNIAPLGTEDIDTLCERINV